MEKIQYEGKTYDVDAWAMKVIDEDGNEVTDTRLVFEIIAERDRQVDAEQSKSVDDSATT